MSRSKKIECPCDGCICFYCRWRGTDNCLHDNDTRSCLGCGERNRQKIALYECEGYAMRRS